MKTILERWRYECDNSGTDPFNRHFKSGVFTLERGSSGVANTGIELGSAFGRVALTKSGGSGVGADESGGFAGDHKILSGDDAQNRRTGSLAAGLLAGRLKK